MRMGPQKIWQSDITGIKNKKNRDEKDNNIADIMHAIWRFVESADANR